MRKVGSLLVVGAPGVGKTAACRRLAAADADFLYVSASGFLNVMRPIHDFYEVQMELAKQIRAATDAHNGPSVIDAHLLIETEHLPLQVPLMAIREINPTCIIHLWLDETALIERRAHDSRKRPIKHSAELQRFQSDESSLSQQYAATLGLKFFSLSADDRDVLANNIEIRTLKNIH